MSKSNKVKFSDRPANEKVNSIALGAAGVAAVIALAVGAVNTISYDQSYSDAVSELNALQSEYDKIQDKSVAVEDATVILNSAKEAGIAVAAIQNQMVVDAALIGTADESVFVEEANSLSDYFSSSSASYAWYVTNVLTDFTWEFNTTYSFTATEVPVLWTCYGTIPESKDGEPEKRVLLAYATGTYQVESNQFTGIDVEITALGLSNQTAIDGTESNLTNLTNADDYKFDEDGNVVIVSSEDGAESKSESDTLDQSGNSESETETPSETDEQ